MKNTTTRKIKIKKLLTFKNGQIMIVEKVQYKNNNTAMYKLKTESRK